MPKLQAWRLHTAVVLLLLSPALARPTITCPAVAPWPDFQPSVFEQAWLGGSPVGCSNMTFALAGDTMNITETPLGEHARRRTITTAVTGPGAFFREEDLGPALDFTIIDGKADEYLVMHVCVHVNREGWSNVIKALFQPSADLPSLVQLMEQLASRPDMDNGTWVLPPGSHCPSDPTPAPAA